MARIRADETEQDPTAVEGLEPTQGLRERLERHFSAEIEDALRVLHADGRDPATLRALAEAPSQDYRSAFEQEFRSEVDEAIAQLTTP